MLKAEKETDTPTQRSSMHCQMPATALAGNLIPWDPVTWAITAASQGTHQQKTGLRSGARAQSQVLGQGMRGFPSSMPVTAPNACLFGFFTNSP